jgi:integrase
MKAKLTTKLLDSLAAKGEARPPIWDTTTSGFGILVGKRTISFFACRRRRGGDGKPIRVPCGTYPMVSLAEGRERANAALRDLHDGTDPRVREAERLKAEAQREQNTFAAVAEDFIARHALSKKTGRAIELLVRRELIPAWGEKAVGDVTQGDVVDLIDEILDRGHPGAAHQVFGYAKRVFSWALGRGKYALTASPFDRLKRGELIGSKGERTRLLSPAELRLIWRATEGAPAESYPDGPYIRLKLMLGVRRKELAGARWTEFSDLDSNAPRWLIPGGRAGRMKNGDPHLVPLPPAAVEILNGLPRFPGCDYVFTARGVQALNDFVGLKRRLDERIADLNGGQPIERWVLHDTRRCIRTNMDALKIPPHIGERILAHRQPSLTRIYSVYQHEAEKREALDCWSTRLLAIVGDNVVPLRQAS